MDRPQTRGSQDAPTDQRADRPARRPPSGRRAIRRLVLLASVVMAIVSCFPTVVARTSLPSKLLNRSLAQHQFRGDLGTARLGWWTPLGADDLLLERDDERLRLEVRRIRLQRGGLGLLGHWPDIGPLTIDHPRLEILVANDPPSPPQLPERPPPPQRPQPSIGWTSTATIRNASLRVRSIDDGQPLIALSGLSLVADIVGSETGRSLEIQPVPLLVDQPLTPELFQRGLQLVAPALARSTRVQGRAWLELREFRLPLDAVEGDRLTREASVRGTFVLRDVQAGLQHSLLGQAVARLSRILDFELPQTVRLVNSHVDFELREGRVYHDGLTFFVPELSSDFGWRTSGSVGLDESLDLAIETRLPLNMLGDRPLLRELSARTVRLRVGGTLDEPRVSLPKGDDWWRDWARGLAAQGRGGTAADSGLDVVDLVDRLLQENSPVNSAPLWEQLRARRAERRGNESSRPPSSPRRGLLRRRLRLPRGEEPPPTAPP